MCYLYILEISFFVSCFLVNILFHSDGCPFVFFMVSFAEQKLLSLIMFALFFYFYYSKRWLKTDLAVIYVKECFPYVFL